MKTLENRNLFMAALLVSLAWHILLALWVNITIVSSQVVPADFCRVSFLGSILEETAFKIRLVEKPAYNRISHEAVSASDNVYKQLNDYVQKQNKVLAQDQTLIEPKTRGDILSLEEAGRIPAQTYSLTPVIYSTDQTALEGALARRRLIYRPELPQRPLWLGRAEGSLSVRIKIGVSGEGVVKTAMILCSSGQPAVDMLLLSNARAWKFGPKAPANKSSGGLEYGVLSVRFE